MIEKEPCPDWCDQHDSGGGADYSTETHYRSLWVQRPLLPPVEGDGSPSWWQQLYLSAGRIEHGDELLAHGPGLSFQQHGSPPMMMPADEARKLAAALIAGAEIVERAQTETCPDCGRRVVPGDIHLDSEDGQCTVCHIIANREKHNRLKLV